MNNFENMNIIFSMFLGIAETGSGKTVAYLIPMIIHVLDQPALQKDDGPIAVCLCPTRELAIQIEKEAYRFTKKLGVRTVTLAGGLSKQEQFKESAIISDSKI